MAVADMNQKGVLAILLWYLVNISTVILNKWLFQMMEFNYPLMLTICHMAMSYFLAAVCLNVFRLMPVTVVSSGDRWSKVAPLAVIFILNIVLGNVSLKYVPVSFMQTVKSAVPAFTYLLQVLLAQRVFEFDLAGSLVPIVLGVMLATWTEVNFNFIGFMCALTASVTTAIQSIVSSLLLTGPLKMDSVNLVYHLAPISVLLLLPFVLWFEWNDMVSRPEILTPMLFALLTVSSALAFALNFSVFYAIKHSSTLTFTVAGNLKVVFVIAISVAIFRNEITIVNALGIITTIVGCWVYSGIQHANQQRLADKQQRLNV